MRKLSDDLMKFSGYDVDEDDLNLIQKSFWTRIRSEVYKKICKGENGRIQWDYIMGRRSRNADGSRIRLSEKNEKYLQRIVDYFETEEGRLELEDFDICDVPEHVDDLIVKISEATSDREMKKEEFKLFLKHKYDIMRHLLR